MPDWFEALNTEICYQLTVIDEEGEDFVMAKVSRRIKDGSFQIRTSKPNTTVCWQVTGVGRDAYVLANPLVVEELKPEELRGRLRHPEAFAKGASLP